jgi:hypothetical protein
VLEWRVEKKNQNSMAETLFSWFMPEFAKGFLLLPQAAGQPCLPDFSQRDCMTVCISAWFCLERQKFI